MLLTCVSAHACVPAAHCKHFLAQIAEHLQPKLSSVVTTHTLGGYYCAPLHFLHSKGTLNSTRSCCSRRSTPSTLLRSCRQHAHLQFIAEALRPHMLTAPATSYWHIRSAAAKCALGSCRCAATALTLTLSTQGHMGPPLTIGQPPSAAAYSTATPSLPPMLPPSADRWQCHGL